MSTTKPSTGNTLPQSYYMRRFYDNNKKAFTASSRKTIGTTELTQKDISALHKAVKKLQNFNYDKEVAKDELGNSSITNAIQAYVDIYNNTMESGSKATDPEIKRYMKQLQKYTNDHKEELAKMGIDINRDHTLKAKKSMILSVNPSKIKDAFSKENGYLKSIQRIARRFESKSTQLLYSELTGNGNVVNTTI